MNRRILHQITLLCLLLLIAASGLVLAHGGEDHGEAAVAPASAQGAGSSQLTTDGVSDQFELFMKYAPPVVGEETTLRLYLSDYVTNKPMEGATFALAFKPAGVKVIAAPSMISPGIYNVIVSFPLDTIYSLVATVAVERRSDFLELRNIYTGEHATHFLAQHGGGAVTSSSGSQRSWWGIAGIVLAALIAAGVVVWIIVHRRGSRSIASEQRGEKEL